MKNTSDLIEALDGVNAVARAIGLTSAAVSNMKKDGVISERHWKRLIAHANAPRLNPPLTPEILAAFNEVGRASQAGKD